MDDDDALLRLAKAIQGEASGDESFKLPDKPAPYRGLERFERIETPGVDFFFGREDEIRALVERLVKQRFVAVVGASGTGKSLLIRAGLIKQSAEEIHPGIRRWQTITATSPPDRLRCSVVRPASKAPRIVCHLVRKGLSPRLRTSMAIGPTDSGPSAAPGPCWLIDRQDKSI